MLAVALSGCDLVLGLKVNESPGDGALLDRDAPPDARSVCFVDDFEIAGTPNLAKWRAMTNMAASIDVFVETGRLALKFYIGGVGKEVMISQNEFDLTNGTLKAQLVEGPSANTLTSIGVQMAGGPTLYEMTIDATNVRTFDGAQMMQSTGYDRTIHKFLRIHHDQTESKIFFDYSTTGTEPYAPFTSIIVTKDITHVVIVMTAQITATTTAVSKTQWDDVSVELPSCN